MRLIDADVLKEKSYSVTVKNEWHMHTNIDVVDMEDIDNAPTVDAVPVVRCKDCKHCEYASNRIPTEQAWVCYKWGVDVEQDWFCAYGERKDND